MKSKVIDNDQKLSAPVTIEVVIENKADLADLWHRFNIGAYAVNEISDNVAPTWRAGPSSYDLWNLLDEIARERGFIS